MASLLFLTVLNLLLALLSSTVTGAAVPISRSTANSRDIDFEATEWRPRAKRDDAPKVPLRILPLGASITWGYLSSTGNGYRKPLRDKLRFEGWDVDMVGSKSNGDMVDNDVEAHSGDVITQVQAAAANSLAYKPNVVLINAGTNDCDYNVDPANAGARMRSLIETLTGAPDMADTLIVLSTLIPSGSTTLEANRPSVNAQFRDLVLDMREAQNVSIVLADMDPPAPSPGNNWIAYPGNFADNKHPNDYGYSQMADIWYNAIYNAAVAELIVTPADLDISSTGTCDKEYGSGVYAGGFTQQGSGEDDGIYRHDSEYSGALFSVRAGKGAVDPYRDDDELYFFFGRLYTREYDDMIIFQKDSDSGAVTFVSYTNNVHTEEQEFTKGATFSTHNNCNPGGVHFIDVNGDGLDDYICIALDGTTYASINNGDGDAESNKPPSFTDIGLWKSPEGYDQAHVRLADIDGDGRADYCGLADNGDITCWRNGWIDDVPAYWQPLGKRFTGKGMGDLRGVRFEDINGDGRDDWMWVDDDGATTTYTNSRSCIKGESGDGLNVVWRQGFYQDANSGPSHPGMGGLFGTSGLRDQVYFARIYGEVADFGELGRQDYVFIEKDTSEEGLGPMYYVHVWKSKGAGGAKIKADGDRYCNMMGHDNGMMDYVWIHSTGHMRLYPNRGLVEVPTDGSSFWGANEIIFDPTQEQIGMKLDRRDLHLADWDGDGACDIIWTNPDDQNKVQVWRNKIKDTGSFDWEYNINAANELYCPEHRGLGFFDRPVHFADVSGNGKADYLCVEKDGRTWGWVNGDDGWEYIDQFKYSEEKDRANLQWADVNGDGKADMIWTDKFSGDGSVWYNLGRRDIKGSRYEWGPQGPKYRGAVEGSCTYFPDLNGDGRADMHSIWNSITNTAQTWYNECATKDHTGDDGPISDPNLPISPENGVIDLIPHYQDNSECTRAQVQTILEEMNYALDAATEVAYFDQGAYQSYRDIFFAESLTDSPVFIQNVIPTFDRMVTMVSGQSEHDNAKFTITCKNLRGCDGQGWLAMMNNKNRLNFCPRFFTDDYLKSSTLLCPDPNNPGQEGICDSGLSAYNADSWALVVVGGYYTRKCGRQIPLPEESSSSSADDSSCPAYVDSSYDADTVYGVNDYVHFGDSYAAGMGTGTTTGDNCRVGSNSYGELVQEWFDTEDFTYTNYACSGDTTDGLNNKIDQWLEQNPTGTTMATLTIGGNDVFFSDLVLNCVLTMWWYSLETYRQMCLETEEKARNLMQDTGSDGLGAKLRAAYEKILDGSGSSSFNLYVPGYVTFFNEDTTDCESTTFWYESPHYDPQQSGNYVWLTTDLRKELNDLVRTLNSLIQSTISAINTARNTEQIHYIDMDSRFDGHRWCEPGTQEPDPDNPNTYFFLSAWPDIAIDGDTTAESTNATETDEISALMDAGGIQLPDADTCQAALGSNPDPYAVFMCDVAVHVKANSSSLIAQSLDRANQAIADKDYSSQDVSWWLPTRQIKTFHPRSPGMMFYAGAAVGEMLSDWGFD
ncbi:SGNH hydrolase-type esterase domain-containing protein [Aspergillus heterothallicus]